LEDDGSFGGSMSSVGGLIFSGYPARDDDLQDSLRRVEHLVAHEVDGQRVFDGVIEALGRTVAADATWLIHFDSHGFITNLGVWATRELSLPVGTRQAISDELRGLRASGQPYRVDVADLDPDSTFAEEAGRLGIQHAVGVPVVLAGQVWALAVAARFRREPFPGDTEKRMTRFVEPVTAALAHAWTTTQLEDWHVEQAALRRLAELAATLRPDELLRVVVAEAATVVDGHPVLLARLEDDREHAIIVAASDGRVPPGLRFSTSADTAGARIVRSGRPERIDDYRRVPGDPLADQLGARAVVAAPVEVEGRLWGILAAVSSDEVLPVGTEGRLVHFAEIAATALLSARTREQLQQLADEQAALLRVSELVARGADEHELFDAVAVEAAGLMNNEATTLVRYHGDLTFAVLATSGGRAEAGTSFSLPADDAGSLSEMVRTRQPARSDSDAEAFDALFSTPDSGIGSSVFVPIVVEDELWGSIGTITRGRQLPADTEGRLRKFSDLVAAAIANSQSRAEVVQLAHEQAALRRVAELVARGASLQDVFAGISVEASRLLSVGAALLRFDPDGYAEIVAAHNGPAELGLRIPTTDAHLGQMFAAGQSVRLADYQHLGFAAAVRDLGLQPGTAVPIMVEGNIWGALKTSPAGAAVRPGPEKDVVSRVADQLEKFAALAAAAIANAENRAQLTASRARIVATADEARQRLQRDVHDGAQQRLVQTVLTLKLARDVAQTGEPTNELIEEALGYAERATAELRDLVHGILPASLSRGGLRSGIESLIANVPMPVELDYEATPLPTGTEITAYFLVAEALTNVVKHAAATRASIRIGSRAGRLTIEVRDNGTGGADPAGGSGLIGMQDRVETAEGELSITSPLGQGTVLRAWLPAARV